jgi:hypothetical protein
MQDLQGCETFPAVEVVNGGDAHPQEAGLSCADRLRDLIWGRFRDDRGYQVHSALEEQPVRLAALVPADAAIFWIVPLGRDSGQAQGG